MNKANARAVTFGPWQGLRWGGSILIFVVGLFVLLSQRGSRIETPPRARLNPLRTESVTGTWRPRARSLRPQRGLAQRERRPAVRPPAPIVRSDRPSKPVPPRPSPKRVVHTVKDGESLWVIARKRLGAGWRWQEIAAANPDVDPDRMREGTQLTIPTTGGGGAESDGPSGPQPQAAPVAVRFHVVGDGETLSEIAARYYSDNDWTRIGRANGLSDPKKLRTGARLVIPPERS
ncbi:MAG: LysM peptidoglycan-binding domain-containing protein [Planctomycetota bacterium]